MKTFDFLDVMRDQMIYAEVVREQYERAKTAFEAGKAEPAARVRAADVESD